jgi:hypothetical protein
MVILLGGFADAIYAQENQVKAVVDLHAPPAQIRKALLHYTPPGSKLVDVSKFLSAKLARPEAGEIKIENTGKAAQTPSNKKLPGAKVIRVYLGQYFDQPGVIFLTAPLIMEKAVTAEWYFDQADGLVDIVVNKSGAVY